MSGAAKHLRLRLDPADNGRLANLCGYLDQHLRRIETRLGVRIASRGPVFSIRGQAGLVDHAREVLKELYQATGEGEVLAPERVDMVLGRPREASQEPPSEPLVLHVPKCEVRTMTVSQRRYVRDIQSHDITFGIGPAGTGKTWLAVACAVDALERDRVERIVLVRPAVEAGERLGFLPGDLGQKVDPYLRPLYDALNEMLGPERVARLMEKNVIELAPLAYMRGRTLTGSFVILDEAQNTTVAQMKMFLTRIGYRSTIVVTGDVTQTDLPSGQIPGLRHAAEVLSRIDDIAFVYFSDSDIVRHPLVQRIVAAYERFVPDSSD
ncbi:MAG: PhoH family protein [Acidiferrobacteraceae bacterium]